MPKSQDGWVEAVRQLYVARRLAVATSTSCVACAKSMLTTAPERPEGAVQGPRAAEGPHAAARAREEGGRRARGERAGLAAVRRGGLEGGPQPGRVLDERIRALLEANAPALLGVEGCGTTTAAALVGRRRQPRQAEGRGGVLDDVRRLPIPASSGKTDRHRLNRGGNRQANWALYEIAIKRMAYDERTRRYVARRTSEGKSRREAVRCLKRYIAREVYHVLMDPNPDGAAPEGPELAKMRKAMRVTQKKAAAELGLSAATLGHLERGKRRSTKLERRYYELLCELERALPQTAS